MYQAMYHYFCLMIGMIISTHINEGRSYRQLFSTQEGYHACICILQCGHTRQNCVNDTDDVK